MSASLSLRTTAFSALLAAALLSAGSPVAAAGAVAQVTDHGVSASGHAVLFVDEAQELELDTRQSENGAEDLDDAEDALWVRLAVVARTPLDTPGAHLVLGHPQLGPSGRTTTSGARAPPRA